MNHFTINNIKDLFELYVNNNLQIKRYGFGVIPDVEDMIATKQSFPVMWVSPIGINYPSDNQKEYNLIILFFDILHNSKINESDVWSDSAQQAEDLIKYLAYNSKNYYDVTNSRIEVFTEKYTDFVAGAKLEITFKVDFEQNDCGIAENEFNYVYPSFLPSEGGNNTQFDCDSLLNCSVFQSLQQQTQTNTDNIDELFAEINGLSSIIQDDYLQKTTFNNYTADTLSTINYLQTEIDELSANTTNLSYVHISGDTMTGGLFSPSFSGNSFMLMTGATETPEVAKFIWNDTNGTADLLLKGGHTTLSLGQKQVTRVVNKTGSNLLQSQYKVTRIRYVSEGGAQGQRLAVVLAQGNNNFNSGTVLGVVSEDISINQEGFITTFGELTEINTTGSLQGETWVDGDIIYLSPLSAGNLTNIKPTAPNHSVVIGYVEYSHAIHGKLYININNGYELESLHNVKITNITNGDLLQYNSGLQVWENKNPLSAYTTNIQFTGYTASTLNTLNSLQTQINHKLDYSGGTVTGQTIFTNGVTATTFSALTSYLDIVYDYTNVSGSTGQVLTNTTSGVQWQTPSTPPSPVGSNLYLFYNY